ncbi:hypothetical protein CHCC14821_0439 [Bacillus paralicheniformis]|nr:hypothetical protein CHCC14821_0439 [Bacillus paralicheniformis]
MFKEPGSGRYFISFRTAAGFFSCLVKSKVDYGDLRKLLRDDVGTEEKTAGAGWRAVFPFAEKLVEIKLRGNREY